MFVRSQCRLPSIVEAREEGRILAERGADLGKRPDVEPALLALRVGIEARREAALGRHHFKLEPGHDALGGGAEQLLSRLGGRQRIKLEELGVV